jgi:glucose-1-phosphate thymidylyltransferase
MKLLILAAGYATRLYPLTRDTPKPLLEVAGRPILDHVLDKLQPIGLDGVYVITNSKFADRFHEWAAGRDLTVIDDGTDREETRLGAIGDIALVMRKEQIGDDLVVVAGDNLFSESLEGFGTLAREKDAPVLAVHDVGDLERIKDYNAIEIDAEGRVVFFEEKPVEPRSTLTGIALYFYPSWSLPLIDRYVAEGLNPDQPGRLVEWLYPQTPVYTWRVPGLWFDIGSKEQLAEADRIFSAQS